MGRSRTLILEYDGGGNRSRYYVHGVSYIDERLIMYSDTNGMAYYYVLDRMYNVGALVDQAEALIERRQVAVPSCLHRQSCTLAALRDALLPKLISGELRVKGAERIIGGHA